MFPYDQFHQISLQLLVLKSPVISNPLWFVIFSFLSFFPFFLFNSFLFITYAIIFYEPWFLGPF